VSQGQAPLTGRGSHEANAERMLWNEMAMRTIVPGAGPHFTGRRHAVRYRLKTPYVPVTERLIGPFWNWQKEELWKRSLVSFFISRMWLLNDRRWEEKAPR
jgi:hypothetical protein